MQEKSLPSFLSIVTLITAEQAVSVAIYVLSLVLALLVLFFDFVLKGGDVLPEHKLRRISSGNASPHDEDELTRRHDTRPYASLPLILDPPPLFVEEDSMMSVTSP